MNLPQNKLDPHGNLHMSTNTNHTMETRKTSMQITAKNTPPADTQQTNRKANG